jgi:hypothetical protein
MTNDLPSGSNIDRIIKKGRIDALLIQEEMIRLHRWVNKTLAGITLYTTLEKSFVEQMDAVYRLQDTAQSQNNIKVVQLLKAQSKEIEEDLHKTHDQAHTMKITLARQILFFFTFRKSCGVSCLLFLN